jgi:hypothetical protein
MVYVRRYGPALLVAVGLLCVVAGYAVLTGK